MVATGHLLQLLILVFSGWLQRQQAEVIEYLKAENRLLRQKLGRRRILFTDAERRLLARRAYAIGRKALAQLKQDEAAKAQFEKYVQLKPVGEPERQRALRYITEPELARARMAPSFAIDTLDGQHISMDDLTGKVVLLDFSATWCGPCREAMPHIREIAKKFQGPAFGGAQCQP